MQAVTGSGKTRLALCAIDALEKQLGRDVQVKIVVPTAALMQQWAKALRQHLSGSEQTTVGHDMEGHVMSSRTSRTPIGLRGGGRRDPADRKYMIYVINSARYELARQILTQLNAGEAILLIADECHHYVRGENHRIFEFLTRIDRKTAAYYSLGLSATLPSASDADSLEEVLGPRIYSYDMIRASAMRTVCPFDIFHIALTFQEEERTEYEELTETLTYCYTRLIQAVPSLKTATQRERFEELRQLSTAKDPGIARLAQTYLNVTYKRKSLVCLASARLSCAIDLTELLDPQERILIFSERISQAEELYRSLNRRYSGQVGRCHSQMGTQANRNTLERFRMGELRILISCRSMDEGVDIPDASVGIILSGTSTQRQRTQRLGRIIRRKDGKEKASLYYLHMEETTEDICFLPESGENHLFELAYDAQIHSFFHPVYDRAARQVLADLRRAGADRGKQQEARRCLDLGRVRGDWVLELSKLEYHKERASDAETRNYWICMKQIAKKG